MLTIAGATISHHFTPDSFTHLYSLSDLYRSCVFYSVMQVSTFMVKSNERRLYLSAVSVNGVGLGSHIFHVTSHQSSTSQLWLTLSGRATDSEVVHPEACQGLLAWQRKVSKGNRILLAECWN